MKLIVLAAMIAAVSLSGTGCASYMVYRGSAEQVAMRKAVATNNERAMRDINAGSDPSLAGIKVTWSEAISERPVLQFGAAIADAGLGYLGYKGIESVSDSNDDEDNNGGAPDANGNASGENTTIIQGDGNTVTVSGSGGGLADGETPPVISP